jgi:hypothetical protein
MQCAYSRSNTYARDAYLQAMFQGRERIDQLEMDKANLLYDKAMVAEMLQLRDEKSRNDVWECLDHPEGFFLSPLVFEGLNIWEIKMDNLEPFNSASPQSGYWFMSGSGPFNHHGNRGCQYRPQRRSVRLLQTWSPPAIVKEYAVCTAMQTSVCRVATRDDEVVWRALLRACLTNIKARDLGFLGLY